MLEMESVTVGRVVKGWREYWRRRSYQRLNGRRGRKIRWRRMRVGPRMRIRGKGIKKMMVRVRDAYMRMMMRLAASGVRGMSSGGADAVVGLGGKASLKEYDPAVILHIYNSLLLPPPRRPPPPHISSLSST